MRPAAAASLIAVALALLAGSGNLREAGWQLPDQLMASSAALPLTRGVKIMNPAPDIPIVPDPVIAVPAVPVAPVGPAVPLAAGPAPKATGVPIRIAALDGNKTRFAGLVPMESPFEVVTPGQQPDFVWDPGSRDVIASGDIIARDIDSADLPSVVDRMAMVRGIKQMTALAPLSLRLTPDTKVHNRKSTVELTVDDVQGRAFYLINVAGDGTVQTLYPVGNDPQLYDKAQFRMKFEAREPFGADQLVAISTTAPLAEFEQAIKPLNERRAAGKLVKLLARFGTPGMRLGSVALYTAP